MRIGIDLGHFAGQDRGADGIKNEETCIREYGSKVVSKLQTLGHTVINCSPSNSPMSVGESLAYRTNVANDNGCDLFVSLHVNASSGNGHGCEVEYISDAGYTYANNICNELSNLGYTNRGPQCRTNLYVLKHTNMTSILIEPFFCDNENDCELYDPEKIANAIVKGLTGQTVQTAKPNESIKALQYDLNIDYNAKLSLTGITDEDTIAALNAIQNIIVKGHKSSVVKWIQQKLINYGYLKKGFDTGIYDEPTFQAVTNMQKKWDKPTDGKLHIETWNIFLTN